MSILSNVDFTKSTSKMSILENKHPKCRYCKINMSILQNQHVYLTKST